MFRWYGKKKEGVLSEPPPMLFGIICRSFLLSFCKWYYRHYTLRELSLVEINSSVNECIECVILTLCYA